MATAVADPSDGSRRSPRPARFRAFGLDLEAAFPLDGLEPKSALGEPASAPTVLELADPAALRPTGTGAGVTRLAEGLGSDGGWSLDRHDVLGYLLDTEVYGAFAVSEDGRRIRCAPPTGGGRLWQHCLRGQVLPLAALLRGFETFHASAVALGGRAIGFVGPSTAGKTSVAVNLVLRGAGLLTDDVLVLELRNARPIAHPGVGVVSLRHAEAAALGPAAEALGQVVEDDGEASRTLVPRHEGPLPLGALYFLDRRGAGTVDVEPIEAPDPRLLLAASFNFVVRTPARLRRQLEVCASLAATVPVFRVAIGPESGAAAVAEALAGHAR
jgi:hypothetical protein